MKKTYISPNVSCINIEMQSPLMDVSKFEQEVTNYGNNVGLTKDNSTSSNSGYNVWDDDWSKN